jgi:putative exosortase-associated protein (TIGR04073 family)
MRINPTGDRSPVSAGKTCSNSAKNALFLCTDAPKKGANSVPPAGQPSAKTLYKRALKTLCQLPHEPNLSKIGLVKRFPSRSLLLAALALPFLVDAQVQIKADLQDPPYLDHGPIRKLSRGLANLAFGSSELFVTTDAKNQLHGNSGTVYGVVSGVGRTLMRIGAGFYEVVTFPAPTFRKSYAPALPSVAPWVQGGFEEFPPELGFESRYNYCRSGGPTTRMP